MFKSFQNFHISKFAYFTIPQNFPFTSLLYFIRLPYSAHPDTTFGNLLNPGCWHDFTYLPRRNANTERSIRTSHLEPMGQPPGARLGWPEGNGHLYSTGLPELCKYGRLREKWWWLRQRAKYIDVRERGECTFRCEILYPWPPPHRNFFLDKSTRVTDIFWSSRFLFRVGFLCVCNKNFEFLWIFVNFYVVTFGKIEK